MFYFRVLSRCPAIKAGHSFRQGKKEGYDQGRIDGYEECKQNFNKIQEFKQKILNKKLDIWKDTK